MLQVTVRVPATTANLGPGFDCLGLALDLWNEAVFRLEGEGLQFTADGEDCHRLPLDEGNLIVQAVRYYCQVRKLPFPTGLKVACHNGIPLGSGMGSSASAVVLGLLGASALLGENLPPEEILDMAAGMEGHADNAAAALLGGLVIIAGQGAEQSWLVRRVDIPVINVAVVLPAVDLPTQTSRAALPLQIPMKDATFNLGRAMLVVEALRSGDTSLLGQVMEDRLHQPYRLPLVTGAEQACSAARAAGAAAVALSGAGPSLIAFTPGDSHPAADAMRKAFEASGVSARSWNLQTTRQGASVTSEVVSNVE